MDNRYGKVNDPTLFKEQLTGEKLTPLQSKRIKQKFVPPIPWNLFSKAARLSPATAIVFQVIWHLHKVQKTNTIKLPNKKIKDVGISPTTKMRALKKLEEAGLLIIEPQKKKASVEITLTIDLEICK